mgnify:CR=1 FL=1
MAEMVTFNEETILAQGEAIYSRRAEIEAMADAVTEKGFSFPPPAVPRPCSLRSPR